LKARPLCAGASVESTMRSSTNEICIELTTIPSARHCDTRLQPNCKALLSHPRIWLLSRKDLREVISILNAGWPK
jgi:hypothetical protein